MDGLSVDFEGDWRFNSSVRELHSEFFRDLAHAGQQRSPPIRIRYPGALLHLPPSILVSFRFVSSYSICPGAVLAKHAFGFLSRVD